jgi:hypothetical protein
MGGHYHVSCFSRTLPTETWAKNGELVFDTREWSTVYGKFCAICSFIVEES